MGFNGKMPTYELSGKVAIVTGSGKGIGYEVAGVLATAGAKIVIADLKQEICDEAVSRLKSEGFDAIGISADVSSKKSVEELAEKTVSTFGSIDILINNAGVTIPESPIFDVTEDQWDFVHNVDLKGLYFTSQVIAEKMKKLGNGGRIVNLTSAAGIMTPKYVSVYGAAKAAVKHLTGIMAKEWARWGINENAVAPGYVNTDMLKPMLENEKNAQVVLKSIPMRRYGEVRDVANVILFLVTEASNYLTGVVIPIDGGMMA